MNIERREFLKYVGSGTLATTLPIVPKIAPETDGERGQRLHQDYQSNNQGTEYYFLGNGLILAALQTSSTPEAGTHCGLLVMSPEHFGRKISTYLYHPERGLQNSRSFVVVDGVSHVPEFAASKVSWEYPDNIPTAVVEWRIGQCQIREELMCPINDPVVVRTIALTNNSQKPVDGTVTVILYPNLMFFDEYDVDRKRGTLTASGYKVLRLFSLNECSAGDRHLSISLGSVAPGTSQKISVILTVDYDRLEFEKKGLDQMQRETKKYWQGTASLESGHQGLDHLFRVSETGVRVSVARSGKMDGGIWQYNLEWVRDQSMVAAGSAMAGLTDVSESLLRRILTRSVDESGKTVDASRHRPPETIELDQNGELLYSLYTHWAWSGNDAVVREHWQKIKNVADYVLQPTFMDPAIHLVKNTREFWERDAQFGVKEGYENTYQLWNIIGLELGSQMAAALNDSENSVKWLKASRQMKQSYLSHPQFSLVDKGRFIKRRLSNGEVQTTFEPPNRKGMPQGMPLNVESVSYCDPDAANALPVVFELVDVQGDLAKKTLQSVEKLWNQRWMTGGYARYDVSSEPDSPGPWPFASLFIARAYLEAGNYEKAWRVLQWLLEAQGGRSGAWFEYYGDRPTPPLPPVGIVVWTWAEVLFFFIHHMLGVRPSLETMVLRPRLLSGLDRVKANVVIRGHSVSLDLRRDPQGQWAMVDGKRLPVTNRKLTLALPQRDMNVEMHL